ncbi:FlgO family outer membrane protein [Paraglaciecola aquimarina]|uniref:FlgO family outer membrane protein n=1 Tax=Paraglaciecola aquimarina TaxID=1235557 RepID=A0ABU3SXB4_9ALTE|nr:FlgO family outer membrane protein [Paraglaciecola aquimarina]MDU0354658.1 FlgO family outer membrane protein [Paraglaciecola aquimarina]
MRHLLVFIPCIVFLTSCAMAEHSQTAQASNLQGQLPDSQNQNSLHKQVEKLVRQLLNTSQILDEQGNVAVGTILPTLGDSGEALPQQQALGIQIQESLMTFVTQAGLKVVEYKATPTIKITPVADQMLSRDIKHLNQHISADYFLTGTYTPQENSTMVNIRLIQVSDNIVLAAATDYIPNDTMWSTAKVAVKNNQIYRNGY